MPLRNKKPAKLFRLRVNNGLFKSRISKRLLLFNLHRTSKLAICKLNNLIAGNYINHLHTKTICHFLNLIKWIK